MVGAELAGRLGRQWRGTRQRLYLWRLRAQALRAPRHQGGQVRLAGFDVQYTDMLSLYVEFKDIFGERIYHFESAAPSPRIIDGGGCIGMSVLYFKKVYPGAKVVCFEPDGDLFSILRRNVSANGLTDVELVQAGLAREAGVATFLPDGVDGGKMAGEADGAMKINTVRLSDYLAGEVDFLKLNIEGQELPVLEEVEASGRLRNVRELVLEYHGWVNGEQRLGAILALLDRQGFRYLVHDFDAETCGTSKPPFRIDPKTPWFCLVYGKRV